MAQQLAEHTTHQLADLSLELVGQTVRVAGMITQVTVRSTRDNRRYYLVGLEDLSGRVELAVWSDVIDESVEGTWVEGQIVLVSVECRERGDQLNLSVRRAAPWDSAEGTLIGFTPEQWQVEPPRRGRGNRRQAPPKASSKPPALHPLLPHRSRRRRQGLSRRHTANGTSNGASAARDASPRAPSTPAASGNGTGRIPPAPRRPQGQRGRARRHRRS